MGTFAYLLNGTLEIITAGRVAGPLSFLVTFRKMKATLLAQTSKLVAIIHLILTHFYPICATLVILTSDDIITLLLTRPGDSIARKIVHMSTCNKNITVRRIIIDSYVHDLIRQAVDCIACEESSSLMRPFQAHLKSRGLPEDEFNL